MQCLVFIKEGRICGNGFKRQLFKDQKHGMVSYLFWSEYCENLIFDPAKGDGGPSKIKSDKCFKFSAYWKDTTERIVGPALKWIN